MEEARQMTTQTSTEITRKAALKLLAAGTASPSEVADLAGVSRQLVRFWIKSADLNWRAARMAALQKAWWRATR